MTLVSYAQNFEDVILWRALKHIDRGSYIDIGAQDPVIDSVSLAFYERHWRGIHVEPVAHYADRLRNARPDEEVLEVAVAGGMKHCTFYEIPETGLSTGSRAIAGRHNKQGYEVRKTRVSCIPLSGILDRYRNREVHWLKIDVEGMEPQVIASWRPSRVRPWIVVVESTEPNSQKPSLAGWEPSLVKLGYEFVYFDGLNRFYISRQHPELRRHFGPGPNFFDDFVLSGLASAPFCGRLNADAATLRSQLAERAEEAARLSQIAEASRAETASLDAERTGLRQQLSGREEDVGRLSQTAEGLRAEAASIDAERIGLRQQLAARAEEVKWLSQTAEGLRAEAASIDAERTGLREQLAARAEEVKWLSQTAEGLRAEAVSIEADRTGLRQQLAARAEDVKGLSHTVEVLRAETGRHLTTLAKTAAIWESATAALNAEIAAKNSAIDERDKSTAALRREATELRQQLSARAAESLELSQLAQRMQAAAAAEAANSARAAAEWNGANSALQAQLSTQNDTVLARDRQIATLETEIAHLRSELNDAAARETDLRQRLAAHEAELARLHQVIEQQNAWMTAATAKEAALGQDIALLHERISGFEHSTSWRVTAPLRSIKLTARWFAEGVSAWSTLKAGSRPRRMAKRLAAAFGTGRRAADADRPASELVPSPAPRAADETSPALVVQRRPFAEPANLSTEPQSVRLAYRRLLQARENLMRPPPDDWMGDGDRLRLAYVSPLPPERSGIADYSAELLRDLRRHYDIDVIVDQSNVSDAWIEANCPVRNKTWFDQHAHHYDRILYHFGNSPFHQHMFDLICRHPGVVVLHDFYLSGAIEQMDSHGGRPGSLPSALYQSHGYNALRDGYQDRDGSVWKYPANLPALKNATGIIVNSNHSRSLARDFYGEKFAADWVVIPLMRRLPQMEDRDAARKALGLGDADFVVCCFGKMGETKLNHRILHAWLGSTLARDPNCHLIFVGEESTEYHGRYAAELSSIIDASPAGKRIRVTGFASPELYRQFLSAADLAVQLRAASRGEASAAAFDCMAYALPTIVNAHGSMADLPQDCVVQVADEFSDAELTAAIDALRTDQARRATLGANARRFVAEHLSPLLVADQYHHAIETFAGQPHALPDSKTLAAHAALLTTAGVGDEAWLRQARELIRGRPARTTARQLLIDVSAIARVDLKTGIQRVVKSQLLALLRDPPPGFRVEPVWLCDGSGQWRYHYARRYMAQLLSLPDAILDDDPVEVAKGDIFFSPDFFVEGVVQATATGLYADWRARGVEINFLVFDLLPLTLPEYFPDYAEPAHEKWISAVAESGDRLICISRSVAEETKRWLQAHRPELLPRVEITASHLGADIDAFDSSKGLPADASAILQALADRPSFLMVGTIEPRKGHLQTLGAFERLWSEGLEVNLVIVGPEGWGPVPVELRRNIPEIVKALREHPQLGERLFWLEGISDEYLDKVYAAGVCLIAASEDEGFGLPLIEASRHKLPILARDILVFREVAGGHASYFRGKSAEALADAVRNWLALYAKNRHPKSAEMPWLTWAQSAERLKLVLLGKDLFASGPREERKRTRRPEVSRR